MVVALRDLGFGLDQIGELLDDTDVEQLRGMLRLRQAQIAQTVTDEQARLRRVEAHLRALERSNEMVTTGIAVKHTQSIRIAEASAVAPGFGHENIAPVFERLVPQVIAHLVHVGVAPGMLVGYYEQPEDDGRVTVHVGLDIGDAEVREGDGVRVTDLPVIEVASLVHRGSMETIGETYEGLVRWIEDSGYRLAGRSRELYLEWDDHDAAKSVTELQMPIAR
jgi:effector-binding domain-containing protein